MQAGETKSLSSRGDSSAAMDGIRNGRQTYDLRKLKLVTDEI